MPTGIRDITLRDIELAKKLGYTIKLLGISPHPSVIFALAA
jgi:homoserine dehydrogenase